MEYGSKVKEMPRASDVQENGPSGFRRAAQPQSRARRLRTGS